MTSHLQRRNFITLLGGAAAAWPLAARAQQAAMPVVGLVNGGLAESSAVFGAAFRRGLEQAGYTEGGNVSVEYHWLDGQFHLLPAVIADLVSRRVAVIATPVSMAAALAAKAATSTIPIVFALSQDPVKFGLVDSLPRPGGNATGMNFLNRQLDAKRLELLHQLVPKAVRIALLVNPANAALNTETSTQNVQEGARALSLQVHVLKASTSDEIDTAFTAIVRDGLDAVFVAPDAFFVGRRVQIATLAAHYGLPVTYPDRENVLAGGLMSYGSDLSDAFHHVGMYSGRILKGVKPADMPVVQSAKVVFAINLKTARLLRIEVPRRLLVFATELIE
jgi:putative ABC transport system substrate-binding protein